MAEMTWVEAMRQTIQKLRNEVGDHWHEHLAREMSDDDRRKLGEAIERTRDPNVESKDEGDQTAS